MSDNRFYVCWRDPITNAHGIVIGMNNVKENGGSWDEVEEVSQHFRREGDGNEYYVGDEKSNPILPTWEEFAEDKSLSENTWPCRAYIQEAKLMSFICHRKYIPKGEGS